ncbi:MAG: patatin-like phospholipase family protein [Leptospirales bacterium]|nr:patatin-like phospholipase family protein [Leptospirales bacterium]
MRERSSTALCLNSAFFGYYAHAGFVKGLTEIGFKPARVTGSSAGAMVGALYCAGVDMDELTKLMLQLKRSDFWEGNFLSQLAKPFLRGVSRYSGLLSGKKIRRLLEPYLGGLSFADLKIPLGIAVSNVTTGRRELRTNGSVMDSVLCSMAFPGLIEVQSMEDQEFIDGGVVDHEPIKELILDRGIKEIVIHMIESSSPPARSPLLRAFNSSVTIIDHETRELKNLLALQHKKKIVRIQTITEPMGPSKAHLGPDSLARGRNSALSNRNEIMRGGTSKSEKAGGKNQSAVRNVRPGSKRRQQLKR